MSVLKPFLSCLPCVILLLGLSAVSHAHEDKMRIKMLPAALKAADIQIAQATSQTIRTQLKVVGSTYLCTLCRHY